MDRRESLKSLALVPLAATWAWSKRPVAERRKGHPSIGRSDRPREPFAYPNAPRFFTDHEFETVRVLSDWIIPADDRSGSATEALVPEFIDYTMVDQPEHQTPVRGGLAWLDYECRDRYGSSFVDCPERAQRELLDLIAYPARAPEEMRHGVEFFNRLRDLVASGFWTSKMGIEDLPYEGNEYVDEWTGCPEEVHRTIRGE